MFKAQIRLYPEAFLAFSVLVGEGASEVGLIRGLDQYRAGTGKTSIGALGLCLVDCGGGDASRPFQRATVFQSLGYRTAIVRDADDEPAAGVEAAFTGTGGKVITWRDRRTLEDELFLSLSDSGVEALIGRAKKIARRRISE